MYQNVNCAQDDSQAGPSPAQRVRAVRHLLLRRNNGLNHLAQGAITAKTLPGTNEPLRTIYTGIEPVDNVLAALTTFFWPATDGSNPTLTLHSIAFSGTFGAAWTLVTLESWRRGNAWTVAALSVNLSRIYNTRS